MSAFKGGLPEGISEADVRRLGKEFQYSACELVQWDLYHRKPVPTEADRLWFFDQAAGGTPHGYSDTNTDIAGQLPGGQAFITDGLGIIATGTARNLWRRDIAPRGSLEIRILDRIYRRAPLAILPLLDDKAPLHTVVTREVKTPGHAWRTVTREETARLYPLDAPRLTIPAVYSYGVVMNFCPRLELRAPVMIGVVLTGWLVRPTL